MYDYEVNIPPLQIVSVIPAIILGTISKEFNGKQLLMDLFNQKSIIDYSLSRFDFDPPISLINGSICNTETYLKEISSGNLFSKKIIHYNRIHVSELGVILLNKGIAITVVELLKEINIFLNSSIQINEIINEPLPSADASGKVLISLKFHPNSFQYYSGARIILASESINTTNIIKESIGLKFVDNTSDNNKPVSILQTEAIEDALLLAKDYASSIVNNLHTEISPSLLPPGGLTDDVLTKRSNNNFDTIWEMNNSQQNNFYQVIDGNNVIDGGNF